MPATSASESQHDEDERHAPSVIIYMVEPFSFGCDQADLQRLACLALLRCFQSVLASVPDNIRSNISVQVRVYLSLLQFESQTKRKHQHQMYYKFFYGINVKDC